MKNELERCDREIEALKAEARNGNPDVEGLMLGLHDWRGEKQAILKSPFPWFGVLSCAVAVVVVVSGVTIEQRFWAKVNKTATCWLWTASKRNKGYGAFAYTRDGKLIQNRAHRYSWEIHKGPIPLGMFVLHRCDVPACVRPDHLFLGSNQENVNDMVAKGRHVAGGQRTGAEYGYKRGESHHNARLTAEMVRGIRRRKEDGASYSQVAGEFGISIPHAFKIVHRKLWSQIQ